MASVTTRSVTTRGVTIWSEGTRLAGDLYHPPGASEGETFPAIVLCHGWGGMKSGLRGHAEKFAAAGYVVLAFDYRGWGESDGKVVVRDAIPAERVETTVRVRVIRELVDPFDELWDVRHALDFIEGEPAVDAARIGLWGSSFGGGLVLWTAAHDERVRCVVSQVGAHDSRTMAGQDREQVRLLAVRQARGEAGSVPQESDAGAALRGTPHLSKMRYWAPVEHAERVRVPVLLIDAEHEELFDRREHSQRVYERMQAAGHAPVKYHVVRGIKHYAIYGERFEEATDHALAWFGEHLRGG